MKKLYLPVLLTICLLTAACAKDNVAADSTVGASTDTTSSTEAVSSESSTSETSSAVTQAAELSDIDKKYEYALECWKNRESASLYAYCSKDIKDLIDEKAFVNMMDHFLDTYGEFVSVDEKNIAEVQGMQVYNTTVHLENADCPTSFTFINGEIGGFSMLPTYTHDFTLEVSDTVKEDYFQIDSDNFKLTAVFTYSGNEAAPTVLLINGSGPSDYNESTGIIAPFEEVARRLAAKGVNSLRMEKRTFRYGDKFSPKAGLKDEYFTDFGNAYKWLRADSRVSDIYLVGHSLGTQIAIEMVDEYQPTGLIFFNGTVRHLADVIYDQYSLVDPANEPTYKDMFTAAKAVQKKDAQGANYGGLTDYYWASYNSRDFANDMKALTIPTTIINSGADSQIFEADLELFKSLIEGKDNFTFTVVPGVNHFGYKSEGQNVYDGYKNLEFSDELIDAMLAGIQK